MVRDNSITLKHTEGEPFTTACPVFFDDGIPVEITKPDQPFPLRWLQHWIRQNHPVAVPECWRYTGR